MDMISINSIETYIEICNDNGCKFIREEDKDGVKFIQVGSMGDKITFEYNER